MDNIDGNRKKLDENKGKMGEVMRGTLKTASRCSERAVQPFQGLRVQGSLEKLYTEFISSQNMPSLFCDTRSASPRMFYGQSFLFQPV